MKFDKNIELSPLYVEDIKESGGIKINDNRKSLDLKLPEEVLEKIKKDFDKNYGLDAVDPHLLNPPYTTINITNNVHTYAEKMSLVEVTHRVYINNIEGESTYGITGFGEKNEQCPDFMMDSIQAAVIELLHRPGENKELNIYIPDPEKNEIGSYKEKYEKAFLERDKNILYSDNTYRRLDTIPPSAFGIEPELEEIEAEEKGTISFKRLEAFSESASRGKINEFLSEAIKELNTKDKEI